MSTDDTTSKKNKRVIQDEQGQSNSKSNMKLREFDAVYKDETHPQHDEAVKEFEELSKNLVPCMAGYRKAFFNDSVLDSYQKQPWLDTHKLLDQQFEPIQNGAAQSLTSVIKTSISLPFKSIIKIPSTIDKPPIPLISPPPTTNHLRKLDESVIQGIKGSCQTRETAEARPKQYETLEARVTQQAQHTRELASLRKQQTRINEITSRATKT